MQIPLEISWHQCEPSPAVEQRIRERARKLEQFYDGIIGCRVAVEAPHRSKQHGNALRIRIDVTVPGAELVVGRDPAPNRNHEDINAAIRDAFSAMERQLREFGRMQRGEAKQHDTQMHAVVRKLLHDGRYGFIESASGREVYFHENAVRGEGGFDALQVGDRVVYKEEVGDEGPQAMFVERLPSEPTFGQIETGEPDRGNENFSYE